MRYFEELKLAIGAAALGHEKGLGQAGQSRVLAGADS